MEYMNVCLAMSYFGSMSLDTSSYIHSSKDVYIYIYMYSHNSVSEIFGKSKIKVTEWGIVRSPDSGNLILV